MTISATINGQTYNLTLNESTGKYEATLTAPNASSFPLTDGYYPVTVTATDEAGNVTTATDKHATLGGSLKLYVKEKVKPVITILSPSDGAAIVTSNPEIKFKVLDNVNQTDGFSGVKASSIALTVGGNVVENSKITKTAVEGGYECTYTPEAALPDGNCTVTVNASDNDGNAAEAVSCTFKIDTVAPTLNVTNPADGLVTNQTELTVSGVTSDATSSPVTVAIAVGGVDQGAVTVGSDGTFNKVITLANGTNEVVITATDASGKVSSITRTVTLKTTAPVIKSVNIIPNPVDGGKTYVISVDVE